MVKPWFTHSKQFGGVQNNPKLKTWSLKFHLAFKFRCWPASSLILRSPGWFLLTPSSYIWSQRPNALSLTHSLSVSHAAGRHAQPLGALSPLPLHFVSHRDPATTWLISNQNQENYNNLPTKRTKKRNSHHKIVWQKKRKLVIINLYWMPDNFRFRYGSPSIWPKILNSRIEIYFNFDIQTIKTLVTMPRVSFFVGEALGCHGHSIGWRLDCHGYSHR